MSTSRFTTAPSPRSPRFVRRSVSGINDTEKPCSPTEETVRLTPSTATEPFSTMYRARPGPASISSTRANPSARAPSTVPVPSTCPCTTWPPRRSDARSGSSRFTRAPTRTVASDERANVSLMTCAANCSPPTSQAVRQTPLTAIESPASSSRARGVSIRTVAPASPSSKATTVPRSVISPVNTAAPCRRPSPLAQARGDQQVIADALALQRERPQRLRDVLDPLALQRIARGTAQQQRCEEQPQLVDLARIQKRPRQARTTLQHRARDPHRAELIERRAHTRRLVLAGGHEHLRAGRFQRVGVGVRGGARHHHGERHLAGRDHQLHALVAQDPEAPAGGLLGRIVGGHHHAPHARLQDRVGAWRRVALMTAGLE